MTATLSHSNPPRTGSAPDSPGVQRLKRVTPARAKSLAEAGIRLSTAVTARWRPGPDFLVIGTKRGGTTSLWNALAAHPQVQPMVPQAKHLKSPHYFYWHYHRGPAWYLGHFPTASSRAAHARQHGASVVGEASPMYLFDPRVAPRVAELLPEVKIVVTLRDPVQRALSHWKERVKEGVESLSFADALDAEDGRLAGELERVQSDPSYYSRALDWYSYRSRGEYAGQLEHWLEHIDPARLLVVKAEDLYADQDGTLDRVFDHVGISPHQTPAQWHNRTVTTGMSDAVRDDLLGHYAPHNERLAQLLQDNPTIRTTTPTTTTGHHWWPTNDGTAR